MRPEIRKAAGSPGLPSGRPRSRWLRWLAKPSARLFSTSVLAAVAIIFAAPASGGMASRIVKAVGFGPSPSQNGASFGGTPAVGALFTTSNGHLGTHFCTASVVNSPHGNLLLTAAHCVAGPQGTVAFVPGYVDGQAPYQIWYVSRIFTDQAWNSSASVDDDVAFLEVGQNGGTPIEDVTGAEQLGIGLAPVELTRVIGYPNGAGEPVICQNWTKAFSPTQLEFDCGGYPDGTSGGPFLIRVDQATGQGTVMGVIGGYQQGGDSPSVSYSAMFGSNVRALYRTAVAGS